MKKVFIACLFAIACTNKATHPLCKEATSVSCCEASVRAMEKGNYLLEPKEGCPKGTKRNMMKCIDTVSWCEPEEKQN